MHLLDEPHHDGSPLYLSDPDPALGDTVTVRLRLSPDDPATRVWVRTTFDAEPIFHEARLAGVHPAAYAAGAGDLTSEVHTPADVWWEAQLPLHNPVTHYRWLLADSADQQRWVSAAGVVEHDPADMFDFTISTHGPAPRWSRTTIVYQIFPDRFARSAAADERATPAWAKPQAWDERPSYTGDDDRTWLGFYGGDLDGIVDRLDHIEQIVGAGGTVYLTPVFPGESNHRYNASTFDEIDPLLGGDEAYARLSEAVHARGWHLLGDLTANHTGDTHEWFIEARRGGMTRDWYYFRPDGSYETWMGYPTLPKLDHTNAEMRAAMIEGPDSTVARWLRAPYSLDGWRIDVANMSGRLGSIDVNHDVARAIRATSTTVNPDAWVIGEHNHDASGDIDGDGWHGTMNYSGFSWPLWSWLRSPDTEALPFGRPVRVSRRDGTATLQALREWRARYGWRAAAQSWNILSSHDSARIRTMVGDPALHRVAAGLQFTLPGVPMVFAGDEIGLEGVNGEDGRRTMPWDRPEAWDTTTLRTYADLARLRSTRPALVEGSLRWAYADGDCLAFLREHPEETLLVVARRTGGDPNPTGIEGELLLETDPDGPALRIWRL